MKKIIIILISFLGLASCQTTKDVLSLQKKDSGDEFLIEKKSPLVMPPEYGKLPTPENNENNINMSNQDSIENLISGGNTNQSKKKENNSNTSSIEQLVLEKIK